MIRFLMIAMLLVSCGKEGGSSSLDAATVDPLDGTKWKSGCSDSTEYEMDFSGGVNMETITNYAETDCATPEATAIFKRSYSISSTNVDYTYLSLTITLLTQDGVDECNRTKCRGLTWTLNVPQNVAGTPDTDGTTMPKVSDKLYQIFKIDGNVLHFGDTTKNGEDGLSPDMRPKDLDITIPFIKI